MKGETALALWKRKLITVIPREGVESYQLDVAVPRHVAQVIPREGVESLLRFYHSFYEVHTVIPREGVESFLKRCLPVHLFSAVSDPERGS